MPPLTVLGRVAIPDHVKAYVPAVMRSWPRERREVWEVHPPGKSRTTAACLGHFLETPAVSFLEETLQSFGLLEWDGRGHSMVVFGDVGLHPDEETTCNGKAGSIFHLVLEGTGTFHLPTVRDKSLRSLQLEPGLAFVFNPNAQHAVSDACPGNLATLSALVPRNFARNR